MARCPFLPEQTASCVFLIFIAIASSRRASWVSANLNDPSELKTAAAALQRGAHRNPDIKSELAVPAFLQQRSIKDKTQPVQLAQLGYLPSYLRPANTAHDGERRVQDACATQSTTFNSCLPDDQCKGCYEGFIESAIQQTLCGKVELELCAIATNCPSCGCESEAEIYYQCLLLERGGCDNVVDCTDSICDAEFLDAVTCDGTLATSCTACVSETAIELFANNTSISCVNFERTVCPAIYDTCGCSFCADKVNSWFTCLSMDICPDLECSAPVAPSPATPNAGSPMAAPIVVPTSSSATALGVICHVCGDETMTVTVGLTTTIDGKVLNCTLLEQAGLLQLLSEPLCDITQQLASADCGCVSDQLPVAAPASMPVTPPVTSSLAPTYSEPCYLCGDPNSTVNPDKTVKIADEVHPCADIQYEYSSRQPSFSFDCNAVTDMVTEQCDCQTDMVQLTPPTFLPPISSPVATPMDNNSTKGDDAVQSGSDGSLAALVALVAIPLIVVNVYLAKRNGPINETIAGDSTARFEENIEAPLTGPSPNTPTPNLYHHQTDSSDISSALENFVFLGCSMPVAATVAAAQNSGEGWSESDSHEYQDHGNIEEVGAGTGRCHNPSDAATLHIPIPYATLLSPSTSATMVLPQTKDQCRSVLSDFQVPIAMIVDQIELPQSERHKNMGKAE